MVLEMSLSDAGDVRVSRVVYALDPGYAVNPLTSAEQMEGGVVWGLTAALFGEIAIKDGRVEQSNFHDYPMVRLAEESRALSCQAADSGAALASRRQRSWRLRSATRSLLQPASASARSR